MGFVEGESLEQRLRWDRRIPFDDARRILTELASALEHAHAFGIVHRDIKPDNVLIERGTGRAVLTDFGIARQQVGANTLTGTGIVMGTPHYMSPEQASGERDIDGRSDIYTLGVLGYRMVAGRLPFEGASPQEVIAQHMSREPAPLGTLAPDVPADLEASIARCLAKDPQRRWPNAAGLREALGAEDSGAALPDDIANLPATGSRNVVWTCVGLWLGAIIGAATRDSSWLVIASVGSIGGAVELAWLVWRGRRHGLTWRRVWRMAFWPPSWWHYWWPRALRRPGDVWDQLPPVIRRTRTVFSAAMISTLGLFLPVTGLAIAAGARGIGPEIAAKVAMLSGAGGMTLVMFTMLGLLGYSMRWQKKIGLSDRDAEKLRSEVTWGSKFWRRPEIARLLTQSGMTTVEQRLDTPADVVTALERLQDDMGEPWRELLAEGVAVAREVAHTVLHIDDELRALARDADPAERERLQQRLDSLRETSHGAEAGKQMRDLVAGQLALMEQLARRANDLASRRSRYMELMRTMWLQFSALRAQQATDALSASVTTGQLRELCRDVEHALAAEQSVLSPPRTPVSSG